MINLIHHWVAGYALFVCIIQKFEEYLLRISTTLSDCFKLDIPKLTNIGLSVLQASIRKSCDPFIALGILINGIWIIIN